jgi:hypothetical protein
MLQSSESTRNDRDGIVKLAGFTYGTPRVRNDVLVRWHPARRLITISLKGAERRRINQLPAHWLEPDFLQAMFDGDDVGADFAANSWWAARNILADLRELRLAVRQDLFDLIRQWRLGYGQCA